MTQMAEMRRVREESLQILRQKEQEITRITTSVDSARQLEERLRLALGFVYWKIPSPSKVYLFADAIWRGGIIKEKQEKGGRDER
jgi:hypothetical protein